LSSVSTGKKHCYWKSAVLQSIWSYVI